MNGVTYDTGALIAADRNDRGFWAAHLDLLARGVAITVPAPCVAEAWRGGGRQANLARLLPQCTIEDLTYDQARRVGGLAAQADHDDIVDVAVVEGAIRRRDRVVTSNPTHIVAIATAANVKLGISVV